MGVSHSSDITKFYHRAITKSKLEGIKSERAIKRIESLCIWAMKVYASYEDNNNSSVTVQDINDTMSYLIVYLIKKHGNEKYKGTHEDDICLEKLKKLNITEELLNEWKHLSTRFPSVYICK